MITLFARANHPHGYGYSAPSMMTQWPKIGIGAHGYVVVGFRCRSSAERDRVIKHVRTYGIDLPDAGRTGILSGAKRPELMAPGNFHYTNIGMEGVMRWYSGGPGDWDYLGAINGNRVDWEWPQQAQHGSRGDNRFFMVYDARELLRSC